MAFEVTEPTDAHLRPLLRRMLHEAQHLTTAVHAALCHIATPSDEVLTALLWTQEDISHQLEALLAIVAHVLGRRGTLPDLVHALEQAAVAEARYRRDTGLAGTGHPGMSRREGEHFEFRRHTLKRFAASVLWIEPRIRPASTLMLQLLYGFAASMAMAFAIIATFWNGFEVDQHGWLTWTLIAITAYAIKDRLKASLQSLFFSVIERHFPDRHWWLFDKERNQTVGTVREQSGFMAFDQLPPAVLAARRKTRQHAIEEQARPESVIFHHKTFHLRTQRRQPLDARFSAITEICRLDLARWLAHTDDPKHAVIFADPESGKIGSMRAPRVYNIAVVYRLRDAQDEDAPWRRLRVVVSRKGIRRIESIA